MSTVDPDAARRERTTRVPEPRQLVLPGVLVLAGAGAVAVAIGSMSGPPDFDDTGAESLKLVLGAVGSTVGALCAVGGMIAWMSLSAKNPRLLGWAAPIALGLLGAGLGMLLMTRGTPVPAVLIGLGVALGILAVVLRRVRSARADVEDQIMRAGPPVTGEVTNQGYTHFGESARILTTATYAFADAQGVRRFVQRMVVIEASDPLVNGEPVDIWFDRQDPANEKRIVVRRRGRS